MAGQRTKATAFELAVRSISRRERTEAEVREFLARRDVDEAEAEEAIARLIEMGQLGDKRYAAMFAQDKRELSGWGPARIREALVEKGVARHLAEAAAGGEDAGELAERAAELLTARGDDLHEDAGRGKALAYLARRGYELEVAYAAVRLAERRAA